MTNPNFCFQFEIPMLSSAKFDLELVDLELDDLLYSNILTIRFHSLASYFYNYDDNNGKKDKRVNV